MIQKLKQIFLIIKKIFHFNISKKISGLKIVLKEKGFIISFLVDNYFSYSLKPKVSSNFNLVSTSSYKKNKFAIILQGPIGDEGNFVQETVKIYNKIFPNCKIILSTWDHENEKVIKKIKMKILKYYLTKFLKKMEMVI